MENEKEGRLTTTWESIIKNADEEAEIHTLHRYEYDQDREPFSPATPAKITPTRRKGVERDYESYLVFGDAQIDFRRNNDNELMPLHDERAMRVMQYIARDLAPDLIVNLGDHVDLSSLSKFKPDSDQFHRTLGPSFQAAHDFYAQLRADNPNARIVEVDSNHNTRLKDYTLKYFPNMYGVRQAGTSDEYPVMSYPHLANLQHLDVEWRSGYGAAEEVVEGEYVDLTFRHGTEHSSASTTAAAKALKNRPDVHTVQGHDHRRSEAFRTNRYGHYIGALVVGTLARTTGEVPGYHSAVDDLGEVVHNQQNWQASGLEVRNYDGEFEFYPFFIQDGVARTPNGREYRGE